MALTLTTNIVIITIVFSVLSLVAVILRFHSRIKQRTPFGLDDYMILPGVLFTLGLGANTIIVAYLGHLGDHVAVNSKGVPMFGSYIGNFQLLQWTGQLISIPAFAFTKSSIVLFYRRIFRGPRFLRVTTGILALISAWAVAFFFAILFECIPVSEAWVPRTKRTGRCYDPIPAFNGMATSNLIIDLAILVMPQPLVWRLSLSLKRKIAISCLFLLGSFVVAIGAARVYFFYIVGADPKLASDVTYSAAPAFYWTNIEACMAVVCACLPTMRPLLAEVTAGRWLKGFLSKLSIRGSERSQSSRTQGISWWRAGSVSGKENSNDDSKISTSSV